MFKHVTGRATFLTLCTMLTFSAYALADTPKQVDIPAGELSVALLKLSKQYGADLVYRPEQVHGIKTRGAHGSFTTEQAVTQLLQGTPLELRTDPSGAMLIAPPTAAIARDSSSPNASSGSSDEASSSKEVGKKSSQDFRLGEVDQGTAGPQVDKAKDEEAEKNKISEIVVTGTKIHGENVSLSPVTVVTRKDIERSGVGTTAELIALLPQSFGGGPSPTNGQAPTGSVNFTNGTGIDLLGLGSAATLTLINGMRVAPSGFGSFVDVSNIPLTAIERVEILTDGASAIYGSDAVAGVVNFILRDNYQGAETGVRYGSVTNGSSNEIRANQTLGQVWDRAGVLLTYEYLDTRPLSAADRAFASAEPLPLDLIPSQRRNSFIVSGHFDWTNNIVLLADAMYSERHSRADTNLVTQIERDQSRAALVTLNTALKANLSGDWRAEVDNGLSRTKEHDDLTTIPVGTTPPFDNESQLWTIDAHADGPLVTIPGGAVRVALGVGHRRDEFSGTTTAGPFLGAASLERHSNSAFGEIRVPLVGDGNQFAGVKRLDLSAAVRYEGYSDIGHSTDPKLNVLWTPLAGLNVRAGWGRSFNVPRLELQNPFLKQGFVADFVALGAGPFPPPFQNHALIVQDLGTNPQLGPEKSTNWTAGIEWSSLESPNLRAHATYFNYRYTDRIGQPASSAIPILQDPTRYAPFLQLNPSPAQIEALIASLYNFSTAFDPSFDPATTSVDAIVRTGTTNLGITRISGIDFGATYDLNAGKNNIELGLSGVRFLHFENDFGAGNVDVLNTIYKPVDTKLRASATWIRGPLESTVFLNYIGSYTDNVSLPNLHVASWTTIDMRVALSLDRAVQSKTTRGLSVSISAQNLLDRQPPRVNVNIFNALGYDPTNANPLGRFVAIELKKAW